MGGQVRHLARFEVRPEAPQRCPAAILYPACLAPVAFIGYTPVARNRATV
jgi:hypothetical protein